MPAGSRLKAVEQQLVIVVAARPGLAGVQISRRHPGELMTREDIWIVRARFGERAIRLKAGLNPRDQDVTVTLMVRVSQEGDDSATIADRAYDLADEVEEALRAAPDLNGEAIFGGVEGGEADSFPDTDGRVCAVQLDTTYRTRKG